jgi:superfamily I DNA and/or RNA helicase/very-short-patch-repair endonuclease
MYDLKVDIAPVYSYAFNQNQLPLISRLLISNLSDKPELASQLNKQNIKIVLRSEPEIFSPETWYIDSLSSTNTIALPNRNLAISSTLLDGLTEQMPVNLTFQIFEGENIVQTTKESTLLYPRNFWGGEANMAELLAAFITPNARYVEKLISKASELLKSSGHGSQLDGYQSATRERPYLMAAALWNVICSENIIYVTPPASFAVSGQRIRLPEDIESSGMGACLDLSILFAACFEQIGLNPLIAVTQGHACCGVWLIDDCFGLLTNDDPMDIRKRIASKDLLLFETTLATSDNDITFGQAIERAESLIDENSEESFVYAIDIKQARKRKIKPLPSIIESNNLITKNVVKSEPVLTLIVPVLPPVRMDELPPDETPEGRVVMWQRKLLDLTKRNRLLNLPSKSVSIKLFCPDVAHLEDMLADGQIFNFITPTNSPLNDSTRDNELFRFSTGNDLQTEFAKEQLNSKILIANESEKKLEKDLLSLFRKAKNDLEEGGANTLFLAIGMLKWKEIPESTSTYRAPLILLPVELIRNSARSKIRIKQRLDDEPTFNSTLIEFLHNDYEVDLSRFGTELPEDESGIDVPLIFNTIRDKIKDIPGFELVEELVLSTFSFAKYLMWKDLRDRANELKVNPFVNHLIESPQKPYGQNSEFIEPRELDAKLKPSDIFAPLNADSSQLVAIDASTKSQDFVLEGPPGTGKSETIANIIAHNIAKGRKVLFVAEKMAALNVVYRRLEKSGLSHLCLELHSNKANKRAVLDQLKKSWMSRQISEQDTWKNNANKLFEVRSVLNNYVNELHKKSIYSISVRQTISRISLFGDETRIVLNWPSTVEAAPVKNQIELESLYETAKSIGLAYSDIAGQNLTGLAIVEQSEWSNAWQKELVQHAHILHSACENSINSFTELCSHFNCLSNPLQIGQIPKIVTLCHALLSVPNNSVNFIFKSDAQTQLNKLQQLIELKTTFDTLFNLSNLSPDIEKLTTYPVESWINQLRFAEQQFVIAGWFTKKKVLKEIALTGLFGKPDRQELNSLLELQHIAVQIKEICPHFTEDGIWQGWKTHPKNLAAKCENAKQFFNITRTLASQSNEPGTWLSQLKMKIVDGREFLTSESASINSCKIFIDKSDNLLQHLDKFGALGGISAESKTLEIFTNDIKQLTDSATKLNVWCQWIAEKKKASNSNISPLIDALEQGLIKADESVVQIKNAFCLWLAPILIDSSDTLRAFRASNHENLISEFRELDSLIATTTSDYIAAIAATNTPDPNSPGSPEGYGVLSREFNRKSNHKPTRLLIDEMGENLLQLTPCMMMSPLSVAQFLPASFNSFDLVVFDEASQITVWDAVGSIARGKNVIVVGDPKQMPPTNFFNKSGSDDASDEEDLESILDQALSARLPHHRLTGHYRSRHESLIAFSNSHYYENSLVTFPSAVTKESAVVFHKVDGLYAKGKGRNNIKEANSVADFIVTRLQDKSLNKLSLGVVTLNTEQQRCIEDCLDERRRKHPELERFFQATNNYDPVFVKNLESVQGDERDVIIFSLGYGPIEPNAKTMSMNFGPLNKQGGERRLNVAVTRSTSEIHVFSSFPSSMIDLSRTSSLAIKHLKNFIEYAERGPIALAEKTESTNGVDHFDSDFEQAIALVLRNKGWQVQTQVGVSKFRIDLGIIHPDRPGQYLAGIECDGATYHGTPAARDRDRVRHIILESLGWELVRIWSTDYFIDPEAVIEKVHEKLNLLFEQSNQEPEPDETEELEVEPEPPIATQVINQKRYFDDNYKAILENMAVEILATKNGISLNELASDISWQHDLARTTKKQLEHIESIIAPWAGIRAEPDGSKTVWTNPADITHLIEWRGTNAFGLPRDWTNLPYPERLGLAKYALEKSPNDPVDLIFSEFNLGRRTASTKTQFETWIGAYQLTLATIQ